jgi:hypothetical protein
MAEMQATDAPITVEYMAQVMAIAFHCREMPVVPDFDAHVDFG